jgi:hypothetical protein
MLGNPVSLLLDAILELVTSLTHGAELAIVSFAARDLREEKG